MPPKNKNKTQPGSATGLKWEHGILSSPFNEEKWNASVSFVVGKRAEDAINIDVLNENIASGNRKLFSVISKEELYATVNELGNVKLPKKGKDVAVPQFSEICEPCKVYLDNNEEIPVGLLAKLIKFRLLHLKTTDQKRRDLEKKTSSDGTKSAAGKGKDKKGDRAKSAAKGKGKGGKTPEPPSAKSESKLVKRGEEHKEKEYIDDEPDDGPDYYVIITGFCHPHLICLLHDIGVTVDSYIEMGSTDYERYRPQPSDEDNIKDERALVLEEEMKQQKEAKQKALDQFWKDIYPLLESAPKSSPLHDVARLYYTVPEVYIPENLEDPEMRAQFGKALFEDIAVLIYNLMDSKRQWKNYLANLKLYHVPSVGEPPVQPPTIEIQSQPPPPQTPSKKSQPVPPPEETRTDGGEKSAMEPDRLPAEVDMRYYNDMMNTIPSESASVPLIMHCMLEQVVASEDHLDVPSQVIKPKREDGLEDGLAHHISRLAFKLALTQEEQNVLQQEFDPPRLPDPPPKQPILLNYHDHISTDLRHLKPINGFDPIKAELEMMGFSPLAALSDFTQPQPRVFMERAARLQELIHFVTNGGLAQAEVDRAFKQFVFECMDWSTTCRDGSISRREGVQLDIPWDDPYPYYQGMIPSKEDEYNITSEEEKMPSEAAELSANEKASETPHPAAPDVTSSNESSRPTTPVSGGILKRTMSNIGSPMSKRSGSVHFERSECEMPGDNNEADSETSRSLRVNDEEWSYINNKQQRNLDQWCFAEHMEPTVLMQVLQNAEYTHQCLDTYYHRRDHTLLVVLHNPANSHYQNYSQWSTKLHSNVGFRNYLEHTSENIGEWVRDEEAKYKAVLLQKEVTKLTKEAEEVASRTGSEKVPEKKAGKGAKDKKKSPRSRSGSRVSSPEKEENLLVRPHSIKAYQASLEAQKQEEEMREKEKELKKAKSAERRAAKEEEKKDDKEVKRKKSPSRPSSRTGSGHSKASQENPQNLETESKKNVEEFWPFKGYDLGNNLLHVSGEVNTALPADGGLIRTEKINYAQGPQLIKCTVLKDGHSFQVHVRDPIRGETKPSAPKEPTEYSQGELTENPDDEEEKKEEEKPCVGNFGSFSTIFNDGMSLAISVYGNDGEPECGKKYEPKPYEPPPPPPTTPPPTEGKATPGKQKKGKAPTPEPPPPPPPEVEEIIPEVVEDTTPRIKQNHQQLHVTCPDGLYVSYMLQSELGVYPESEEDRNLVVKQYYPFKTRGTQKCEAARFKAMDEISRVINTDGTVVKIKQDGSIQVLYADGRVTEHVQSSPLIPESSQSLIMRPNSASKSPERERETPSPNKKVSRAGGRKSARKAIPEEGESPEDQTPASGYWITTSADGQRHCTRMDGSKVPVKDALISVASDPSTSQSMQTREDHVVCVTHPDGTTVVEHADGTRITNFYRHMTVATSSSNDMAETGEEPPMETKEIKVVVVECPGFATVKFDQSSLIQCSTEFGSGTVIHASLDGAYDLYHHEGGCLQIDKDGSAQYYPRPNNELEIYNPNQNLQYCMRHFADIIVETVDNEGNVFNVRNDGTNVVLRANDEAEDEGFKFYKQHAPRLFVIHPDGSGTELLRYQDISEYMMNAEDDPSTAILMDALPDCTGILGITVLKPYTTGSSEYWMKSYLQESIVPPGLVSRDLINLPAMEEKKPGPEFGTNVGTGLAVGGAVKMLPMLPMVKCPSVLQVRQILQYKPVSAEQRDDLWSGLRAYGNFVREKLEMMEGLYLEEPRSEKEQVTAQKLQELVMERQKQVPKEASKQSIGDAKCEYERSLAPQIPSPPPTPQTKRTQADWERDQRELQEAEENKRKLRNCEIPPYFKSELGKAFLLTQAPDLDRLRAELKHETAALNRSTNSSASAPRAGGGVGNTPSLRPGNPTPGHANGNGSPSSVRPNNPTPGHGHKSVPDRPGAPTPKQVVNNQGMYSSNGNGIPKIPEEKEARYGSYKQSSLTTTVTGEKRDDKVQLPRYLDTGRPQATSNVRYAMIEDPVRRKVLNSSVAGANVDGAQILARMRGFEILPERVNFGVLREGNTYSFRVLLKNTGVDSCRFRIKQPPPSTGMKVLYKPGPIAAGMKGEIIIEVYAIAVGVEGGRGVGTVTHNLEIVTETDHLYLPVKATVMTAYDYDNETHRREGAGVRLVSTKPPGSQGIIQARKDAPIGAR